MTAQFARGWGAWLGFNAEVGSDRRKRKRCVWAGWHPVCLGVGKGECPVGGGRGATGARSMAHFSVRGLEDGAIKGLCID